ncbi:MAG: hypothetical protein MJZ88_05625, partial [Paludibacteraceae bacterium]|nr:hypothetical protein [Paludibacteraceae bacterium]
HELIASGAFSTHPFQGVFAGFCRYNPISFSTTRKTACKGTTFFSNVQAEKNYYFFLCMSLFFCTFAR